MSTKQSSKLPENVDVLIIGSGITGASLAHHLLTSNPDISVIVTEARTITSGATGRNGGQILALPYEGYKESVVASGLEATKSLIEFRGGHLNELLNITKTVFSEKAARESEIRTVETVDAVFDHEQWIRTKDEVEQYLNDSPEQKGTWRLWEGDEAEQVIAACVFFVSCRFRTMLICLYSEIWNKTRLWCGHRQGWCNLALPIRDKRVRKSCSKVFESS